MASRDTHIAIAKLTDEGVFEDLALSVLRAAHPLVGSVVQTGLNAEGRTHRSPVDAIGFVPGSEPDHMVSVHHTITGPRGLRRKWLSKSDPIGDVPKTIAIIQEERKRAPDLAATLVLTTNREPSETLVRDVRALGRDNSLEVEIWSLSNLAHVLDTTADGQAIRRRLLGFSQDRLSRDLFAEIGRSTLNAALPRDDPSMWIDRTEVVDRAAGPLGFLIGSSGSGKTVACLQALSAHLEKGGVGLVLDAAALGSATSLDDAIDVTLRRYSPQLADGRSALEFGSSAAPVLIVVEDVNRSGDGPRLATLLASWILPDEKSSDPRYKVLCPIWPQLLVGLDEKTRSAVDARSVELQGLSVSEATEAVQRRAASTGRTMTPLQAREVAEALGCDPLLIALHEPGDEASAERVIGAFIERALQRCPGGVSAASLRGALDRSTIQLLSRRNLDPDWSEIEDWSVDARDLEALQLLLADRAVISLQGPSTSAQLAFRHDRIREHLLVRAAGLLHTDGRLTDDLLSDPAFAEVIGGALVEAEDAADLLVRARTLAPLALADAFRRVAGRRDLRLREIVAQLDLWIEDGSAEKALPSLQWLMTEKFTLADGPDVIRLVKALGPLDLGRALARLRNGDLEAGVYLCARIEPDRRAIWAHRCIAHAQARHSAALLVGLQRSLPDGTASIKSHSGRLRLAGHIGDPSLLPAILEAWEAGIHRTETLGDYVWAATRCVGSDLNVLDRFYDAWGALSDESDEPHRTSPRQSLASYELKGGFMSQPPVAAMPYLVRATGRNDLGRQVLYLLEHIDDPVGLSAVAEVWAAKQRDREPEKLSFGPPWRHLRWERLRPYTESMSEASRDALAKLWLDEASDDALALASFTLWEATHAPGDLALLDPGPSRAILTDHALRARLQRGDASAIPDQIARIRSAEHPDYWWQFGRSIWAPELTALLDEKLSSGALRYDKEGNPWLEEEWIHSELLMRLDTVIAEPLLIRHWDHIRQGHSFVQAALYHATPATLALAADAINEATDPKPVLRFTMMHFNQLTNGRGGFVRQAQVLALEPYLQFLEPSEVEDVGEACNAAGWFDLRRLVVDPTGHAGRASMSLDQVRERLASIAAEEHRGRMLDIDIRHILETGWTWSQLFDVATDWARSQADEKSALILAGMVSEAGRRKDIAGLETFTGLTDKLDRSIADAAFVVRRRSLS